MYWIGYVVCCWLAADFVSGIVHWWEDRYANERWPIIGKFIAIPNQRHHSQPLHFLQGSYWYRNYTTIIPAAIGCLLLWKYVPVLFFVFISQANEIHAWGHRKGKLPGWVVMLQEAGILVSPKGHAAHHVDPFICNYCPMSDLVNPFLEYVGFWGRLERLIAVTTGIKPLEREG